MKIHLVSLANFSALGFWPSGPFLFVISVTPLVCSTSLAVFAKFITLGQTGFCHPLCHTTAIIIISSSRTSKLLHAPLHLFLYPIWSSVIDRVNSAAADHLLWIFLFLNRSPESDIKCSNSNGSSVQCTRNWQLVFFGSVPSIKL